MAMNTCSSRLLAPAVVAVALLAGACGSSEDEAATSTSESTATTSEPTATDEDAVEADWTPPLLDELGEEQFVALSPYPEGWCADTTFGDPQTIQTDPPITLDPWIGGRWYSPPTGSTSQVNMSIGKAESPEEAVRLVDEFPALVQEDGASFSGPLRGVENSMTYSYSDGGDPGVWAAIGPWVISVNGSDEFVNPTAYAYIDYVESGVGQRAEAAPFFDSGIGGC